MTDLRPDKLAVNWEEAKGFLSEARLHRKMLVLEDQHDGEIIQRMLLSGGPDEYHIDAKDLETGKRWEKTVSQTEAAEIIAGWSVVERRRIDETEPTPELES